MEAKLHKQAPGTAQADRPNLTGIPTQMKLDFERRSGLSFDDVRVHYNSGKPARLRALAYTRGTQVYMGPGQERHLRHELGHVIQQKRGFSRYDTMENGVPVSNNPEVERQADLLGSGCSVQTGLEAAAPGNIPQVIMKYPKKRCNIKGVGPYVWAQRMSHWRSGRRSTTPYGLSTGTGNQGPHIYPFIMWEVIAHAFRDAGRDLGELAGTRLLPYPRTARRMMIRIAQEAADRGRGDPDSNMRVVRNYYRTYLRRYRAGEWRQALELNPFHTYSLFKPASHGELKGKGERRTNAVDQLMDSDHELPRDIQDETSYVREKSRKQGVALQQITNDECDLSMDSEYEEGDSDFAEEDSDEFA